MVLHTHKGYGRKRVTNMASQRTFRRTKKKQKTATLVWDAYYFFPPRAQESVKTNGCGRGVRTRASCRERRRRRRTRKRSDRDRRPDGTIVEQIHCRTNVSFCPGMHALNIGAYATCHWGWSTPNFKTCFLMVCSLI